MAMKVNIEISGIGTLTGSCYHAWPLKKSKVVLYAIAPAHTNFVSIGRMNCRF
ncbi:hypothetical Protein YC6258_04434 [Gynuella sunshinyii YC6258]|uniref:Uncharacterized protein n=1 Tax=Gynuella sunshinyii YC6258 TaxID=1445510 RepID=A0A0C5VQC3_9GAMM|nr:hypothetical Protein YC6258_04434 [Gynuella sunshinyii YC6258]